MPTNVTGYNIPVPDATDPVDLAGTSGDLAAMATAIGTALDTKVGSGGTVASLTIGSATIGTAISSPNYTVGLTTDGSNTVALDFSTGNGFHTRTATGAVTITGSNYLVGVTKTVRIVPGGSARALTVPGSWVFVGNAAGTSIPANKTAVVTATSFGTAEADVVAAYAVQP